MKTLDFKPQKPAKALIIGHDPRLQKSDTQASFALFADYYFMDETERNKPGDKDKYGLGSSTYIQIADITNNSIDPHTIYVTNLCNDILPASPKGKTVYIPEFKAIEGVAHIYKILQENPSIEYIFPMSQQVSYWLHKLGLYNSNTEFEEYAKPKGKGVETDQPYYEPSKPKAFQLICGSIYTVANGKQKVIPVLHSKNYPLKGSFVHAYSEAYETIKAMFI